jgi:hypothetical protein
MNRCHDVEVTLPQGLPAEAGGWQRTARVRGVVEGDEGLVSELSGYGSPLERATALLARCVTRVGGCGSPGAEMIDSLSLGDREALLLHLRRLTFGERIACLLECPSCEQKMELELAVADLLLPPGPETRVCQEETFSVDGQALQVVFRLPRATDFAAALRAAEGDAAAAVRALILACVEKVQQHSSARDSAREAPALPAQDWPEGLALQLSDRMEELDPQAEIMLRLVCPFCEHGFSTSFDTTNYLIQELLQWQHGLYGEVHQLARAYHWSEAEILNMPARKRRKYLDLLSAESVYE